MFESSHYVPVLKAKEGEFGAVRELPSAVKDHFTPLFDVPPVPMEYDDAGNGTLKAPDKYFGTIPKKLHDCWGKDRRLFLDTYWTPGTEKVADGRPAITFLMDELRTLSVKVVPVTGLRRDPNYQSSVCAAVATDKRGLCLRLEREDFDDDIDLKAELDTLLKAAKLKPEQVDLIVDLRSVLPGSAPTEAKATRALVNGLPYVKQWRTLTVAASAFPKTLSDCGPDSINSLERTEWLLWCALHKHLPLIARVPTFGDYLVASPDLAGDIDPRKLRMSSNLRYTTNTTWLVFKGRSLRKYKNVQFRRHCSDLIKRTEYSGRTFSWGDNHIYVIATDLTVKPGSPMTWRKIATSHHISYVTDQIATLPSP